ncbi:MAG: hypothetical protein JW746_04245 [Candidatus Krumholzibacteriota bacterium]|nr:hypothetical protein [Candidatus Krumholzibacteriota bacterium]
MKQVLITLMILSISLAACSDSNPSKPDDDNEEENSPYTGSFSLVSEIYENDCAVSAPPGSYVNITVIGDSVITFGTIVGDWDSLETSGGGTSEETTIPVLLPDCYAYYTVTFYVEFSDYDNFTGTYGASYRKDDECPNPEPCSFLYTITGSR